MYVRTHSLQSSLGYSRDTRGEETAHPYAPPHVDMHEKGPTECSKKLVGKMPGTCTQGKRPLKPHRSRCLLGRCLKPCPSGPSWLLDAEPSGHFESGFFSAPVRLEESGDLALRSVHLTPQAPPPARLTAC